MPKKNQPSGFPGIEPHKMAVPGMDRPSVMFAMLLDAMVVDHDDEQTGLVLVCRECGDGLCMIETADSLRVLLNTALAHRCYD